MAEMTQWQKFVRLHERMREEVGDCCPEVKLTDVWDCDCGRRFMTMDAGIVEYERGVMAMACPGCGLEMVGIGGPPEAVEHN